MKEIKVIIAVDSFKGSASSREVAESIEKGIKKFGRNNIIIKKVSIADGGEGTVEAIVEAVNGEYKFLEVPGPLGDKVKARFGVIRGNTAVLEMAESSGLNLIKRENLNPYKANTYGVGEMLKAILDMGIRDIYIGLGGSATNDGGAGMLASLGVKFYNIKGEKIGYTPEELKDIAKVDISGLDTRISEASITVLSDVCNSLCGINGASYIYGPQKGAKSKDVKILDKILENYGNIIDNIVGKNFSKEPGSGAAGGLGYAFLSICGAEFKEGIVKIMELIELENLIKDADLVITGEGRIDNQSVNGKAPVGIAKTAKKYNIPVIAVVGSSARNLDDIYANGIDLVMDIINEPMNLEKAIHDVKELLEFAGEKAMRAFLLRDGH
ncbi:glycerate kinase [Fusobacterium sp.]|uniref:glycerate kinase n=1 Tax=Fusobacterium sp. TaxID=68766 RepID=UPI002902EBC2|nr:glycerate kinase [Fusobacterium sp.]MDU1911966.1 glycerate kinase [Fusobacterium sp.]